MKTYRNLTTSELIGKDPIDYIADWLSKYPGSKIAIGSDSKYKNKGVLYITCIAMFYPVDESGIGRGAHVIYAKERYKGRVELFHRLWTEVEYSQELAVRVTNELGYDNLEIHIDLNPSKDFKSNIAYTPAIHTLQGMGYKVCAKPDAPAASCAADLLSNKKS